MADIEISTASEIDDAIGMSAAVSIEINTASEIDDAIGMSGSQAAAVSRAKHGTLDVGVVDTVVLLSPSRVVQVVNRSTREIYFTLNGETPTIEGDDTLVVLPGKVFTTGGRTFGVWTVRLAAAAAAEYSVQAVG